MKIIRIRSCHECPECSQGSTTSGIDQCAELIGLYLKTSNPDDWEKAAIRTGEILPDCPLEDYKEPLKKWVNWFYSDYHQSVHYQGENGGPNNDGIFDTLEDARQYVIDNKVSNCTGQKEIPCSLLEDNTR